MPEMFRWTRHWVSVLLVVACIFIPFGTTVPIVRAISADLVISQVYGGGGSSGAPYTNDFVEIFNRGTTTVSLNGLSIQYASATGTGNFGSNPIVLLSGSLAPGQYYLVQLAGGTTGSPLPTPDASGSINASASAGKFALVNSTNGLACNGGSTPCSSAQQALIIDLVGYGNANFFEGAPAPSLSNTTAAFRNGNGCVDTDNNASDFSIGAPNPRNSSSPTNPCSTPPPMSGNCPDVPNLTLIHIIQGTTDISPCVNEEVLIEGIVIGDFEGPTPNLRGFYVQEEVADQDDNPLTSEGIFVFNGNNNNVSLGDIVRVRGLVSEFQGQTQISAVQITVVGNGTLDPTDVVMPFPNPDYLERFEGMLVRFPMKLVVTEHFQLGRFGQVVMSAADRLYQPTSLYPPGPLAQALQAANDLNRIIVDDNLQNQNPDPILFGRGGNPLSATNTLRGGDSVTGLIGVMTYTWSGNAASGNAYRVRPVGDLSDLSPGGGVPNFVAENPRPTAPPNVGGSITVVGMNLLNYFNTFNGCTNGLTGGPTNCRGAENATEFARQTAKTVAAIVVLNPTVLGVIEVENDGYDPTSAIADLVNRLNAATTPGTYTYIDVDAATGQVDALGNDAIKVGIIYQPALVTPVGRTAVLNSATFVNGGDSTPRNRAALAQAFSINATSARFVVSVNHFKSKGSPCDIPDAGDGQGNCNIVRVNAANALAAWLATDPTGVNDPDVLIIGDLNSYAKEDPIRALETQGYENLIERFVGANAYSYVFNGQWGYLDYALATASLSAQVTGVAEWHINADEPPILDYNTNFKSPGQISSLYAPDFYRTSDHDPVIVGLDLDGTPPTTIATVSGTTNPLCPSNCYVGSATVALTATDDRSTTVEIAYRVNGGTFQPYSGPLTLSGEGTYTVDFFARDSAGNVEPTQTVTVKVSPFPVTSPLDTFNRADGRLGRNWSGATQSDQYRIVNNAVTVEKGGLTWWRPTIFGPDQEAFMRLTAINPSGQHHTLALKVKGNRGQNGAILVSYDAVSQQVVVEALVPGRGFLTAGTFPAVLQPGDTLGAWAKADGTVEVFVRCESIGAADTRPVAGNRYVNTGGRIGVWFHNTAGAAFDDFGGGTLTP
jgi:predicted extracellular nuclease